MNDAERAQSDAENITLEVEAIATSVTEMFEKVAVQAQDVNDLCESMRQQASFFARWNKLLADGGRRPPPRANASAGVAGEHE
mmetsp:Transcript_19025/g.37330  ORF Transcript_19025/g.37330 Transcript_19025/m.37330 type:complete len:83 (+) Transcript_19025:150-398(+)